MEKLVILDRDGVINYDSENYITRPQEWKAIPGSLEAIAHLNQQGYQVVVASNQSGVGRGLFDEDTLEAIHDKLHTELAQTGGTLAGIFYCPHTPQAGCSCRKPRTGLLENIAREMKISLQGVPLVGDSLSDLQAARLAGCRPWLVKTGKGQSTLAQIKNDPGWRDIPVCDDLAQAVEKILK